jgi:hypothetical protein
VGGYNRSASIEVVLQMDIVRPRLLAAAAALVALAAGPTSASAQGTPEERRICGPDAVRLCREFIPDLPKVNACMERHQAELSEACRALLFSDRKAAEPAVVPADQPTISQQATTEKKVASGERKKRAAKSKSTKKKRVAERERKREAAAKRTQRAKREAAAVKREAVHRKSTKKNKRGKRSNRESSAPKQRWLILLPPCHVNHNRLIAHC